MYKKMEFVLQFLQHCKLYPAEKISMAGVRSPDSQRVSDITALDSVVPILVELKNLSGAI